MVAYALYHSAELPWALSEEEQRRFRKILRRVATVCLLLALIIPFLPVPQIEREQAERLPPRLAKLVLERGEARKQPPAPTPLKVPAPKTANKAPKPHKPQVTRKQAPQRAEQTVDSARRKAQRAGLLAFSDELAALRDDAALRQIERNSRLTRGSTTKVASAERAVITAGAARSSGGINTANLSRDTGGAALAGRQTVAVSSPVASGNGVDGGATGRRNGGRKAARSIEEIQLVFDRNKAAIYSIYNRALRENPALQGKVVLKITITPAGRVSACELISTELESPGLERKIIMRVRLFDFGAKDVETMVVTYPIEFLPS
jgi:outer membrane biosynthesis protein TonB